MSTFKPSNPDRKPKPTEEIHNDIDGLTSDGYNGLTALDGIVDGVVGDLSDSDIAAIEDYLNTNLTKRDW